MKKIVFASLLILSVFSLVAQKKAQAPSQGAAVTFDQSLYNGIRWRELGPFRGGRSSTVTGVVGNPNVYYFGGVGGGVWKTTDAGRT